MAAKDKEPEDNKNEHYVNGVSVDHPAIVEGISNMYRRRYSKDDMVRIIGMPYEVIDKHVKRLQEEEKR